MQSSTSPGIRLDIEASTDAILISGHQTFEARPRQATTQFTGRPWMKCARGGGGGEFPLLWKSRLAHPVAGGERSGKISTRRRGQVADERGRHA